MKKEEKENPEAKTGPEVAPEAEAAAKPEADEQDAAASDGGGEARAETPAAAPEPDWKALYAITLADFDNYKKRAARDREDVYRYAEGNILKDVLPSVDNLSLALEKASDPDDPFVKGVRLVYDTLVKALSDHGAKMMENVIGGELDPNFHEALATIPSEDYEEGKICNIVKTGWMLGDKLLRAAQVVVSAGKKTEG